MAFRSRLLSVLKSRQGFTKDRPAVASVRPEGSPLLLGEGIGRVQHEATSVPEIQLGVRPLAIPAALGFLASDPTRPDRPFDPVPDELPRGANSPVGWVWISAQAAPLNGRNGRKKAQKTLNPLQPQPQPEAPSGRRGLDFSHSFCYGLLRPAPASFRPDFPLDSMFSYNPAGKSGRALPEQPSPRLATKECEKCGLARISHTPD